MFRFIELLAFLVLLWFIANFVRFIVFVTTGAGEDNVGFMMGMSDTWVKAYRQKKDKKEAEPKKGRAR